VTSPRESAHSSAALTANDITRTILQGLVCTRFRFRLTVEESIALDEGICRIDQYEFLLAHVIPDLRRRLHDLEARTDPQCNLRVEL
jgi:hypothetical protein